MDQKENNACILSLIVIEERDKTKKVIFRNKLKKLNFVKTFEDIIENELDFHDNVIMKTEIQRHPHDINPLTFELHKTLFDVLNFNAALKVINITLAYENDENGIIVYTPVFPLGVEVEPLTKFLERGWRLDRISIFRGGLLGKKGWIFSGGVTEKIN